MSVSYANLPAALANEDKIALFYWDQDQWVLEPTGSIDTIGNRIFAMPDHMTAFAIIADLDTIFLPIVKH